MLNLQWKPSPRNAPRFAEQMVKGAQEISNVKLDYSPASLRRVDQIIGQLRSEGQSVEEIAETLFCFGCYAGEVLVRHGGGKWRAERSSPFGLVVQLGDESFCDPIGKAFKFFEHGEGESLAYFYRSFAGSTE
jgi:hypothetical protein